MLNVKSWWNLFGGWLLTATLVILSLWIVFGATIFGEVPNTRGKTPTKAELDGELAKFETAELAFAEIERRLVSRIERNGFTLTIQDSFLRTIFVVPIRTQWIVSCDKREGLRVQIGNATPDDDYAAVIVNIIAHSDASILSIDKCKQLANIAGSVMSTIAFAPGR